MDIFTNVNALMWIYTPAEEWIDNFKFYSPFLSLCKKGFRFGQHFSFKIKHRYSKWKICFDIHYKTAFGLQKIGKGGKTNAQ